mgnify:CR=1 FL=1
MNPLAFDFKVDKSTQTAIVTRQFNADLSSVWDAFTTQEILDQWWAPKPFESRTKRMEFRPAGRRFYAMVSPEGHEMWQVQEYVSITPKTNFKFISAFADKDENLHLPGSNWDLSFSETNGITTVLINIHNDSLERMERMIEMGFKEGFTATLNELEKLLQPSQN